MYLEQIIAFLFLRGSYSFDKYKVLIPKAWGIGNIAKDWINPFIIDPHSVCTETYLVVGPFDDKETAENVITYMQSKFFHAMVSMVKISQNAAKGVYRFVPVQDFHRGWNDKELYSKYKLTQEEIDYIETSVKSPNSDQKP